jgi:isopenicillin-N epimerase
METSGPPILSKDLFLLDPDVIYLNHGAFGAIARPVFEKYQAWQRELERQPAEFLARRFADLMLQARRVLGAYINADPDNLVYVPNVTTGLNIVARSLRLGPGDEILATDHEYGALDGMWRFLCGKTGAVYKQQPIPLPVTTDGDFIERVWAGVTLRTRVLFISHIPSATALIFPIKELCRRARAANIVSMIDGAHAVGQIPLDMEDIGADFYSSNLYKWLGSPKGSAFLHARPEMQNLVEPLVVSWGYTAENPALSRFVNQQEWTGARDIAAYLATPDAIQFYEEHHWEIVRAQCHALLRDARERITAQTGLSPICPDSTDWYMQMSTLPLPKCDLTIGEFGRIPLQLRLKHEFNIEVPISIWHDNPFIRVSIQAYNTREDVQQLVNALTRLLDLRG